MKSIQKFKLLSVLVAAFITLPAYAEDPMERIQAWEGAVSEFKTAYTISRRSYSKWAHMPGNESKGWQEFLKQTGTKEADPAKALKAALLVAEKNATDDLGFMAIRFLMMNGSEERFQDAYFKPAVAMLEAHYLTDPRMESYVALLCRMGANGGAAGDLMLAVVDKIVAANPKGSALRVKAAYQYVNEQSRKLNDLTIPEAGRAKLRAKFTKYATLASKEAGDFTIWRQPAKKMTARLLNSVTKLSIGNELPNAQAGVVGGGDDELANYRGKVVLLDFWATWCVPCVANLPKVVELKKEMAGTPFEVIAISVDDSDEDVLDFMEDRMELPFVNWRVGMNSELYRNWNINGVPTYFLIDEKGVIQARGNFAGIPERARELVKEMTK